ncbi:hypothetical protein GA0115233_103220 [Streptomyces sp. DI166]|nr:hypothetical protein GA0115233_103220 [Streptomyces sp. DI166]
MRTPLRDTASNIAGRLASAHPTVVVGGLLTAKDSEAES